MNVFEVTKYYSQFYSEDSSLCTVEGLGVPQGRSRCPASWGQSMERQGSVASLQGIPS